MILKINLPGAAARDERLHQRLLSLHQMHQVMAAPFMQQVTQRHLPQFGMHGRARQILRRDARQQRQIIAPQRRKFSRQIRR